MKNSLNALILVQIINEIITMVVIPYVQIVTLAVYIVRIRQLNVPNVKNLLIYIIKYV